MYIYICIYKYLYIYIFVQSLRPATLYAPEVVNDIIAEGEVVLSPAESELALNYFGSLTAGDLDMVLVGKTCVMLVHF